MKWIKLSRGMRTCVNDSVFTWASIHKWYAQSNGGGKFYAARDERRGEKRRLLLLHREILRLDCGALDGEHKNGDSLNNLISNLRPATRSQNHANRIKLPKNKHSKFRGVSINCTGRGWTAQISIQNKKKHLGSFQNEIEAAEAYDVAAKNQFGKFARLNFP